MAYTFCCMVTSSMKNYRVLFQRTVGLMPDIQSEVNLASVSRDSSVKFY